MTIKELKKLYPDEKKWIAFQKCKDGSYFPNWNYKDNDFVIDYKEVKFRAIDITKALIGVGKNGRIEEKKLKVKWERR